MAYAETLQVDMSVHRWPRLVAAAVGATYLVYEGAIVVVPKAVEWGAIALAEATSFLSGLIPAFWP